MHPSTPIAPMAPLAPRAGALPRRRLLQALAAAGGLAVAGWPGAARASGTLKLLLPVSAGSGVDAIVRAATGPLGQALGSAVVVDNQPGAGGVVGTQALVRAPADGQTLGVVSNNHVIFPAIVKGLSFDPLLDITPITILVSSPMVLVTRPNFPARDLREFRDELARHPGRYNFGSSGNGTILHLGAELFKDVAGVFSTHIPYRGTAPLMNDVMGGQVDWAVLALPAVRGALEAGRLKALAVASPQRVPGFATLPTAAEQGFDKYIVEGWVGVVGPKGLPADIVARTHAAFTKAYQTPEVKDAMARQGNGIILSTPDAAAAHFRSEMQRYAALVKKSGMTAQ